MGFIWQKKKNFCCLFFNTIDIKSAEEKASGKREAISIFERKQES